MAIGIAAALVLAAASDDLPLVRIDRDNTAITQSCRLQFAVSPLIDSDGNGVVHIAASGITVDCEPLALCGATGKDSPDSFKGVGIRITGKNVTLMNANVTGYKVGVLAIGADGLTIKDSDISGNFQQRLKSTPQAEDGADWLWPHANDNQEWRANYGAGICVERSKNVTLRNVTARHEQNGIILDRVEDSKVFDCDCSFLSGWGLAMWRSSRNVVDHNAFDFCVRGYSHGVYNRGQDSAGILLFEQCDENQFIANSVTHGGDGLFGFGGKEALGEEGAPVHDDPAWYKGRGCDGNLFLGNDFSYAAAHGLELTFSFDNRVIANHFASNGICGVWGGYSQRTKIFGNEFVDNGSMAYGLERGGVNIEHGRGNEIRHNRFSKNACGVHLWWDADENLMKSPWGRQNDPSSSGNTVANNRFDADAIGVQLRQCQSTIVDLQQFFRMDGSVQIVADEASRKSLTRIKDGPIDWSPEAPPPCSGVKTPVGARKQLEGRDKIVITEWGPYDWQSPLLLKTGADAASQTWKVLGKDIKLSERSVSVDGDVEAEVSGDVIRITAAQAGAVVPYKMRVDAGRTPLIAESAIVSATWSGKAFASAADPRKNADEWRRRGMADGVAFETNRLELDFGMNGPSQMKLGPAVDAAKLPHDDFGIIASTKLKLAAGRWRLRTISDDGIRVSLDDQVVIEDWTHHGPTPHDFEFAVDKDRDVSIRVEHFELDGYATLSLGIEPVEP